MYFGGNSNQNVNLEPQNAWELQHEVSGGGGKECPEGSLGSRDRTCISLWNAGSLLDKEKRSKVDRDVAIVDDESVLIKYKTKYHEVSEVWRNAELISVLNRHFFSTKNIEE